MIAVCVVRLPPLFCDSLVRKLHYAQTKHDLLVKPNDTFFAICGTFATVPPRSNRLESEPRQLRRSVLWLIFSLTVKAEGLVNEWRRIWGGQSKVDVMESNSDVFGSVGNAGLDREVSLATRQIDID